MEGNSSGVVATSLVTPRTPTATNVLEQEEEESLAAARDLSKDDMLEQEEARMRSSYLKAIKESKEKHESKEILLASTIEELKEKQESKETLLAPIKEPKVVSTCGCGPD